MLPSTPTRTTPTRTVRPNHKTGNATTGSPRLKVRNKRRAVDTSGVVQTRTKVQKLKHPSPEIVRTASRVSCLYPAADPRQFYLRRSEKKKSELTAVARLAIKADFDASLSETFDKLNADNESKIALLKDRIRKRQERGSDFTTLKLEKLTAVSERQCRAAAVKAVAEHYQITERLVRKVVRRFRDGTGSHAKARSGRPKKITTVVKRAVRKVYNEISKSGAAVSGKRLSFAVGDELQREGYEYETVYLDSTRKAPNASSIHRVVKDAFVFGLRPVPPVSEADRRARYDYTRMFFETSGLETQRDRFHVDESYIELKPRGKGVHIAFPGDAVDTEALMTPHGSELHPVKILILGVVTLPELANPETCALEGAKFKNDGKVALLLLRSVNKYKRRVYHKDRFDENGKREVRHEKGEHKWGNLSISSKVYSQVMQQYVVPAIRHYTRTEEAPGDWKTAQVAGVRVDDKGDIIGAYESVSDPLEEDELNAEIAKAEEHNQHAYLLQEDGAPGHGYNNLLQRKPNRVHENLKLNLLREGIMLEKQPAHSPDLNALDNGVWCVLKAAVENRFGELPVPDGSNVEAITMGLWKIIKDAWDNMSAADVFNIVMQTHENARAVHEAGGQAFARKPHAGIRERYGTGFKH